MGTTFGSFYHDDRIVYHTIGKDFVPKKIRLHGMHVYQYDYDYTDFSMNSDQNQIIMRISVTNFKAESTFRIYSLKSFEATFNTFFRTTKGKKLLKEKYKISDFKSASIHAYIDKTHNKKNAFVRCFYEAPPQEVLNAPMGSDSWKQAQHNKKNIFYMIKKPSNKKSSLSFYRDECYLDLHIHTNRKKSDFITTRVRLDQVICE